MKIYDFFGFFIYKKCVKIIMNSTNRKEKDDDKV